ncbi:MAG: DUF2779 domain-containing protein [Bacteriovoracia bacterium]
MSNKSRYLTKSRFKIGHECPTKLFYLDDKRFGNNNTDNSFLEALAEGGFQVGELAKVYHPNGIEITTLDKDSAVSETQELLKRESVTIYEAAFRFENLFIRADVVVKNGDSIELIEVKAKSFDPSEEDPFYNKTSLKKGDPKLSSEWAPYLIDVAFQSLVIRKCLPGIQLSSHLMLADKSAVATVNGINQKFFLEKDSSGRSRATTERGTTKAALGAPLLVKICVDREIELLRSSKYFEEKPFEEFVEFLSDVCQKTKFVKPTVGSHCKSCEFRIDEKSKKLGLESGFEKCWEHDKKLSASDFVKPFVFDIWNFRKASKLLDAGKVWMAQVDIEDISPTPDRKKPGLSSSERQWLQVEKIRKSDPSPYLDVDGLAAHMRTWKFPLNFIDFETTLAAIPFHIGRRPYEQIAFQFSHHIITEDGVISHANQFISAKKGQFPNFEFVRALRDCLSKNDGTIFRYATHENTVLCQIRNQLRNAADVEDREELIAFIESITEGQQDAGSTWTGPRAMVDMCELVKRFYYHPETKGSNSIKKVLPAILNGSSYLQSIYSQASYGSNSQKSLNFVGWAWIQKDEHGKIVDPYKLLPPIFDDLASEEMDSVITDGSIADGGAAMTAYSRMQFTQISAKETDFVIRALLKYCELDTLAMVMIYQHWKNEIEQQLQRVA